MRKNPLSKLASLLLITLLISLFSVAGCNQAAKKPDLTPQPGQNAQVPLTPEVTKYKEEPTITLYRSATGKTEQLKLEEYLKGVVAAEIGPKFPMEALKAQAIVARTMTLALINYEHGAAKHGTDASDDHTEFQAYDNKQITDEISKAVEETRGQILTYDGKFVYAEFHSASPDMTASIEEGFPKLKDKASAYIVPVATNGLQNAPEKYRDWTVKVPKSTIKNIMGSKAGSLDDIKVAQKGPSGRALTVTAGSASIAGVDLREKVGFDKLFSTYLTSISVEGDNVVFKGKGWGHGCGMEQWGAYTMAQEGKSAKEIVEHYYPGTMWTQLYK
ncbi:MAG: SpoIID/LytB domain-containing protein [Syntrophomonadaceae bacterium]|nr:SpoIID/LytB domain-containing protein [Syntrophomonadaceae bacterium]